MEIKDLKAFITVAEYASFSLAANHLHLTQPAISKRIAALERELGARLLDRIGKRVFLTEAGSALIPNAKKILSDVDETRKMITSLSDEVGGRLSIATSHHIGLHRLPTVLRAYTNKYPNVDLDIQFMDSEAGCEEVARGSVDLAIVTLPSPSPANLVLNTIWNDPLDIVVGHDHPLLQKREVNLEELVSFPTILPPQGTYTRTLIIKPFQERQLTLDIKLETNYLETIKMMVAIGLGWSALPQTMITEDLHRVPVTDLRLKRTLGIVQHRSRTLSNAARALAVMLL